MTKELQEKFEKQYDHPPVEEWGDRRIYFVCYCSWLENRLIDAEEKLKNLTPNKQ